MVAVCAFSFNYYYLSSPNLLNMFNFYYYVNLVVIYEFIHTTYYCIVRLVYMRGEARCNVNLAFIFD